MRLKLFFFVCVVVFIVLLWFDGVMVNFEGLIDIDDLVLDIKIFDSWKLMDEEDEEDEDDGLVESGSGSGEIDGVDVFVMSVSVIEILIII